MELDNNHHSVFLMYYHLILVIKYRRKVIDHHISDRLKEIFEYIAPTYNITLKEWNHDTDHLHILFKAHPNSQLSKFINAYKSASSRLIKKEYPKYANPYGKNISGQEAFACLQQVKPQLKLLRDTSKARVKSHEQSLQVPDLPQQRAGNSYQQNLRLYPFYLQSNAFRQKENLPTL